MPSWLSTVNIKQEFFSISPNPTKSELNIGLNEHIFASEIVLLDVSGREIMRMPYSENINLGMKSGIYLIQLIENSKSLGIKRIVVK